MTTEISKGLEDLSVMEGGQSPPVAFPMRSNLPLPPELRDEIWRLLLKGEYDPKVNTYKYHTNPLSVSKAMGEDSKKFMLEHSTFVILHYQINHPVMKIIDFVPRVCQDPAKIVSMADASMVIDFKCLPPQDATHKACTQSDKCCIAGTLLLLQEDLPQVCDVLALFLHGRFKAAATVTSAPKKRLVVGHEPQREITSTRISFPVAHLGAAKQRELLGPLLSMQAAGHTVTLTGLDPTLSPSLVSTMNANIIMPAAMTWSLFESILKSKSILDRRLFLGEPSYALIDEYACLFNFLGMETKVYFTRYTREELPPIIQHLITARLETLVTIGFLAVRLADENGIYTFMKGWPEVAFDPDIEKLPSYLDTNSWVAGQHMYWLAHFVLSTLAHNHRNSIALKALKKLSQKHPNDKYLKHDLTLLQSCVGGPCVDSCYGACTDAMCCGGDVSISVCSSIAACRI
jgi:hypothetical protein